MKTSLFVAAMLASAMLVASCDEEMATLGGEVMPQQDQVSIAQAIYPITTQTVQTGAVVANAKHSFIGSIIDPETKAQTTSSYMAQFHLQENFSLADKAQLITDATGNVVVDSCFLRIHHTAYFGDSLATMKLRVQEIDINKGLSEADTYRSNLDFSQFITPGIGETATTVYTALDQSKSAASLTNSNVYRNISVALSQGFGSKVLNTYYTHPEYYKNSFEFSKHVTAGFLIEHTGGLGTIIEAELTTLDVYYRQHRKTAAGKDTIATAVMRIGATQEVVQNTIVSNSIPSAMLDASLPYTYIKSPAGLHTVATLPVDAVAAGKHYTDSINSAKLVLQAHQGTHTEGLTLPKPNLLLLLPTTQMERFFEGLALPNSITSYLASYNSNGFYSFDNIAPLISHLRVLRDKAAGVTATDSEATRQQKWAVWEAQHPDWNKVAIIPVSGDYTVQTDAVGRPTKTLQRLRHNFYLNSVKLQGGSSPVELSVIYSRFAQ